MALDRLRRSTAQSDERDDDAEADAASDDIEVTTVDVDEVESGGSRLGTLKKGLLVAVVAASIALAVRRFRGE